ncbi:MAG TPA: hypothetical protein VKY74_20160 [Chloroflexia bacterium]|nr:hypothetical protein [Chloroflexia bacterium]
MDETVRVRCPACETRLDLPPRATYATCRKCGSEYLVSRRGGAYTLQPLTPEEFVLSQQVATVEREGEMGCANTALSISAGVVVLFCVIGGVGRFVFNNTLICLVAGIIALGMVSVGAVVMLRNLRRDQRRRARLVARQEALAAENAPP